MVVSKKYAFLIITFLNVLLLMAQDFSGNWKSHFAYVDFVDLAVAGNRMYVASENTLFVHDAETRANTEYTTVEGLSGEDISTIYYSDERELIIVGYKNGLVEIIDEISGKVTSLVDIQNKLGVPPANVKVNDFFEDNSLLYIATGFGVVVYNLETNLFGDTFLISDSSAIVSDVVSVGVLNDTIFASIVGQGTFSGNKTNRNLIEFGSWTQIQNEVFDDIQLFSGQAIAHNKSKSIYEFDGVTFKSVFTDASDILNFEVNEALLSVTLSDKVIQLTTDFTKNNEIEYDDATLVNKITHAVVINNEVFFTSQERGFFKTESQSFQNNIIISPSGPLLNNGFALDVFDGDLWMVYGNVNASFTPVSGGEGASRLRNLNWLNLEGDKFEKAFVLSDVIIDRKDKNKVFIGSHRRAAGLFEISNGETIIQYTHENSNLEQWVSNNFTNVFTFDFDSQGDLWVINNEVDRALKRFQKEVGALGSNDAVDITDFIFDSSNPDRINVSEICIDEDDNVYMAASRSSGVVGYQIKTRKIASLPDEDLELSFANLKTLALDLNGDLWVGSIFGLRVIENPERMFEEGNNVKGEPIIIEDEEAGGIAQELFFRQSISDIKVDANNNKWIGTAGGVFYLSPDGQEVLLNFTKDNSPLPSNVINDIAIDETTGTVFFATDKGLMEYNGGVTVAQEDFDTFKIFPNPVRPEYNDVNVKIQGLTVGANVKITDVEGNLVFETQNETFGGQSSGQVEWDTRSFSGRKVASGVYLVLVTGEEGEQTTIGKILIVR